MAIEARSIDWVPETERHGRIWHQAPLWFLGNFQYFSIPIGFVGPALGLSLGWTIVAGVLGIVTGTIFMAFHAAQGPTLGLPQMIQSRAQFGYRGVIVPLFATAFTYLAFNVADQVLLAEGLNGTFGWNKDVVAIVCCVGAALLAIYGHDWVHRIFRILLYISFPLMVVVTVGILIGAAGGGNPSDGEFVWVAFMAQFSAAAAYNITYAPYVSDYSRYLPKETTNRSIIASVFFGASGSAIWLIALGAWLATSLGATDGLVGLMTAGNNVIDGLGDLAAFFSAAALAATMGMNAYGGALTVLTAIDSVKPITPTRRMRVITILALAVALVRDRQVDQRQRRHHRLHRADPDAVPARAVDGGQPGRLLLRPPRPLRDHRAVQARRDLRPLGLARPDGLRARLRCARSRSWSCPTSPAGATPGSWRSSSTASTSPGSSA